MNRALSTVLIVPALAGCSSVSGVWMIVIPYQEDATTCTESLTENFVDGYQPEGGTTTTSDWTFTEDYVGSDALMFAQIETTVGGEAVLVIGAEAWPGVKDQGSWVFTWSDGYQDNQHTEHTSGYHFEQNTSYVETSSISLSIEGLGGDSGTGLFAQDSEAVEAYIESDAWEDEVRNTIGSSGQIPSDQWLVYEDGGDEFPQDNVYDEADCTADCQLTITTTCTGSTTFTAVRTDYKQEDSFDYLRGTTNGS